jgi:phage terminase large subunit-like protein
LRFRRYAPLPFPDRIFTKALLRDGEAVSRKQCRHILSELALLPRDQRRIVIRTLTAPMVRALAEEWWWRAHGGQDEPEAAPGGEPWNVWAIVAGRGFGKTRAGAEWVWARAREDGSARIALVAATIDEVERVMVTGESGLVAVARAHERVTWRANKGILHFPSGAEAHAFSAERPERLRGPQHHYAWCDELAKWPRRAGPGEGKADMAWNNLMLGLRLGERPRAIVTTTPRPAPLLRRVLDLPRCAPTHGRTAENPHLPADFRRAVEAMFGGTRLGRQELDGILLEEFEGALWSRELLEKWRGPAILPELARGGGPPKAVEGQKGSAQWPLHHAAHGPPPRGKLGEDFGRVVIGLDPPASSHGDSCGIVVCASDREGVCWVVADLSAPGLSPRPGRGG